MRTWRRRYPEGQIPEEDKPRILSESKVFIPGPRWEDPVRTETRTSILQAQGNWGRVISIIRS